MYKFIVVGGLAVMAVAFTPSEAKTQSSQLSLPTLSTQAVSSSSVSPLELQQFVQGIKQLQSIDRRNQAQMAQVIEKEGLSPERFREIAQNIQQPNTTLEPPISEQEQEKFARIVEQMEEIQKESLPKQQRAITMQGLEVSRFGEIDRAVQQDAALQKKVRQMLGAPGQ